MSFIVLSLPRSRSAWLAHFLTMGGAFLIGHDLLLDCEKVADFVNLFGPPPKFEGSCETGAIFGWKLLRSRMPETKILCIHRPVMEVVASLVKKGVFPDVAVLEEREAMLQACAASPGVESLEFSDLDDISAMRWVVEYLLGKDWWDSEWWMTMQQLNIQVNLSERMERLSQRGRELEALSDEVMTLTKGMKGGATWMQ